MLIPTPCELLDLLFDGYACEALLYALMREKAQKLIWIFLLGMRFTVHPAFLDSNLALYSPFFIAVASAYIAFMHLNEPEKAI